MRTLFFLLLLANAVFLAYERFGDVLFPGESQLLQQQINPGAIRLLTPAQVATATAAVRTKIATCLEWGGFSGTEAARANQALAALAPGARIAQRRAGEVLTWWVFVPPQGSRQAAMVKAGELKRLGVEDYFVLQDESKYRFAISLGVFRTQDAARNRLEQLRARGVRSAQVEARDTQPETVWLQMRDIPEGLVAKLNELRQGFPGSELKDCPAEEKG